MHDISSALEVALMMQPEYTQAQLAGAMHNEAIQFALEHAQARYRKYILAGDFND